LIAAVAAIVSGYFAGGLVMAEAIQALIAALAAYMIGTGLDNPAVDYLARDYTERMG